jgi:two-component system nitrate/nitrite response regulator NarL
MSSSSSVLVLSDAFLFQEGVKTLLKESGLYDELFFAENPNDFEKLLQSCNPKLVVLDIPSSVFRVEKVLAFVDLVSNASVLLLGEKMNKKECKQLLGLGAKGVILKYASKNILTEGLKQIDKNEVFIDEESCSKEEESSSILEKMNVSTREREIIKLIAQGLINKEIAEKLFISTHTVNTHRKNLMAKLNINNTAGIVLLAVKEGIVSPNEFLFI